MTSSINSTEFPNCENRRSSINALSGRNGNGNYPVITSELEASRIGHASSHLESDAAVSSMQKLEAAEEGRTLVEERASKKDENVFMFSDEELVENGGKYTFKKAIGQVTVRCPNTDPLSWIAIIYGFIPWLIPALCGVHFLVWRRLTGIYALGLSVTCAGVNEACLKPLIQNPRPRLSANKHKDGSLKYGMPSGHVLNSFALMIWAILEIIIMSGPSLDFQMEIWFVMLITCLGLPVPWARWYNLDHTWQQCFVSCVLGLFAGICAFVLRARLFPGNWELQDWSPWLAPLAI